MNNQPTVDYHWRAVSRRSDGAVAMASLTLAGPPPHHAGRLRGAPPNTTFTQPVVAGMNMGAAAGGPATTWKPGGPLIRPDDERGAASRGGLRPGRGLRRGGDGGDGIDDEDALRVAGGPDVRRRVGGPEWSGVPCRGYHRRKGRPDCLVIAKCSRRAAPPTPPVGFGRSPGVARCIRPRRRPLRRDTRAARRTLAAAAKEKANGPRRRRRRPRNLDLRRARRQSQAMQRESPGTATRFQSPPGWR